MRGYATGGLVGGSSVAGQGMGGISVYAPVTITQQGDNGTVNSANATSTAKQLQGIVQTVLTDRFKKEMGPGGLLYKEVDDDGQFQLANPQNGTGVP